jgi:HEAT repeat protein
MEAERQLYSYPPTDETRRMLRLVRRLRFDDPVRIAVQDLAGGRITRTAVVPVLASVAGSADERWRSRIAAAWALAYCPTNVKDREVAGNSLIAATQVAPKLSCMGCLPLALAPPFLAIWVPWALWHDSQASNLRATAIQSLARIGYVPALPRIIDGLNGTDVVYQAAADSIPTVLNRVTEDDYGRLPRDATPAICTLLRRRDERTRMAALSALEAAGDGRAVTAVRRIAETGPDRTRQFADRVLAVLEERHRRESDPARLLRATDVPAGAGASLVRPAGCAPTNDPAELLRPVRAGEDLP